MEYNVTQVKRLNSIQVAFPGKLILKKEIGYMVMNKVSLLREFRGFF